MKHLFSPSIVLCDIESFLTYNLKGSCTDLTSYVGLGTRHTLSVRATLSVRIMYNLPGRRGIIYLSKSYAIGPSRIGSTIQSYARRRLRRPTLRILSGQVVYHHTIWQGRVIAIQVVQYLPNCPILSVQVNPCRILSTSQFLVTK